MPANDLPGSPAADLGEAGRAEDGRTSRADSVYALLKRDIAEFRLVPGDRFTENEVCERLGVSRTPVRQALFRMKQEGFVDVSFRAGWHVLPFDFDKFEQLYDLRMVLETEAVRRLCGMERDAVQASLADLAAIWLVAPEARLADMARVGELDEAFHCALVAAAGNGEMARVHGELTERIRIIRRLDFTKRARVDATYDEHAQILRAILAHRADEAMLLLRAHISASQSEVRKITLHEVYLARIQARGEGH
ncbi:MULTISPECIES: GntR family transcriptional regulator [Cupriavidus]